MNARDELKKHDTSKRKLASCRLEYNIEFRKQLDTGNVQISQHPLSDDKVKPTEELIVHSTIENVFNYQVVEMAPPLSAVNRANQATAHILKDRV